MILLAGLPFCFSYVRMAMRFSLVLFGAMWLLNPACRGREVDPDPAKPDTARQARTYLALGDSYTIGESVDSAQRFPAQLAALLAAAGKPMQSVRYIARTGWRTDNLAQAISTQNPVGPFTLVTLLIGVNDQYQRHDTTGYRLAFTQLLNRAIGLAGGKKDHVFMLSIPDYGVTPFGRGDPAISREIDQFNAINQNVTRQNGVVYIDITPISRQAATDPDLTAGDGLHPSGKHYGRWAALLAPEVLKVLP